MTSRPQSDPLVDGGGRIQRLLNDARKFSAKAAPAARPGPPRPTLANPSRPFTPKEDVRSFYPAVSSLSRMRTPAGLGVTLSPLNQSLNSSLDAKQMLATPHAGGSPLRRTFSEDTPCSSITGVDAEDPTWMQIQAVLPLLDHTLSEETLLSALDKLLQITQGVMGRRDGPQDSSADKRLRPAISRLEKLQGKSASALVQIKAAEIILLAAPEGLFYPSQCYQLYKLSKDPRNDEHFRRTGVVRQLLALLLAPADTEVGALTLAAATLCHVTEDQLICKAVAREYDGIATLRQALQRVVQDMTTKPGTQEKGVNLAIQLTSCLRNLSEPTKNVRKFAELGVLPPLLAVLRQLSQYKDLVLNVSRILAKVSLQHECRALINSGPEDLDNMRAIVACLGTYCSIPAIVDRLAFTLGNLTHTTDNNRVLVMRKLHALPTIVKALLTQLAADERLSAADAEGSGGSVLGSPTGNGGGSGSGSSGGRDGKALSPREETEGALIRLLRVVGNLSINREVGVELCTSSDIANALFSLLNRKQVGESEELVLNCVSCITNLSYYEVPGNEVLSRQREVLTPLALLVLHDHDEVVHESVQAFGNFSRRPETRGWMIEKRIDEALVILLDHHEPAVVTAVAGVLMNFSADPDHCQVFNHFGAMDKLVEWLDEFNERASEDSVETLDRLLKIFCNLLDLDFFPEESAVAPLHGRLCQLAENLAAVGPTEALDPVARLVHRALQLVAQRWPAVLARPDRGDLEEL
eukprot:EG_transcript_3243